MTDRQIEQVEKAENILTALYWEIKDNPSDKRVVKRLDTILGKLYELKNLR